MKVELIKDHLENKSGEVLEVSEGLGNYMLSCKIGKAYIAPKKTTTKSKK